MKLFATMMVTLDGVYQGPGGPDEDRRAGFDRGGWTAAYADQEMGPVLESMFGRADGLLLGRKTFDIWEPYWPDHDDDSFGHTINVLPKYVPSTTRHDTDWQNTHFIANDLETAIRELKAKPGKELQVHGSGVLLRWLLERDLVGGTSTSAVNTAEALPSPAMSVTAANCARVSVPSVAAIAPTARA